MSGRILQRIQSYRWRKTGVLARHQRGGDGLTSKELCGLNSEKMKTLVID